jgi:predicted GIY-YIG superfamily endonuclease
MVKNYYVYGFFKENTKELYYVGITKNIRVRMNGHRSKSSVNPIKQNYMKKYGCRVEILWENLTVEEAQDREMFLIGWFGTINEGTGILTNILTETTGICSLAKGSKRSKETKRKMSKSAIERNKNPEYITKQRESQLSNGGFTIDEIHSIISEWEHSDNGMPITKNKILEKYKIKKSRFNGWVDKYRPELNSFTTDNKKKHVKLWMESNLSQREYGESIGVDQRTISLWMKKW